MEKFNATRAMREFIQSTLPGFPLFAEPSERALRAPAPLDRERARAACAPMGVLTTVVVTEDAHKRRRTWYIVEPDPSLAHHYAAQGFELVEGCKVLIDAEAMRPVALIDLDPASSSSEADAPAPCGFNPYWDLPPT
ncbi:MAG TPA: hypothetical protein VGL25_09370 [Casimicrobiaceae bacterium]|jgi:hypothetical protein